METQRRTQVITEALGKDALQNWQSRMKEGVVVDLQIKRWRGRKQLNLNDLGITPSDLETERAYRELLKLGSKLLLPQEVTGQLDSVERYARQILTKYAFSTPWGYFLPYSTYSTWCLENEKWRTQYFTLRDEIVEQYPTIVATLLSQYEPIGKHTYQLMCSHAPDVLEKRALRSEEEFLIYFLDEIRTAINSPEQIYASFVYEADLKKIDLPDVLSPQRLSVDDQQVQAEAKAQQQERLEALERERQERQEVQLRELEARQREEMMYRMNIDVVRDAQRKKEQLVETFFGSLMTQLRTLTYDVATDVLESIKKQDGETIRGRSIMQLRNLIEQVRSLNFYRDRDVETIMDKLKLVVDQDAKDRDVREIQRQLRSIALVTRKTLLELGEDVRSERDREIDIPDVPSEGEVREARLELELPLTAEMITHDHHSTREERTFVDVLPPDLIDSASALRTERD